MFKVDFRSVWRILLSISIKIWSKNVDFCDFWVISDQFQTLFILSFWLTKVKCLSAYHLRANEIPSWKLCFLRFACILMSPFQVNIWLIVLYIKSLRVQWELFSIICQGSPKAELLPFYVLFKMACNFYKLHLVFVESIQFP